MEELYKRIDYALKKRGYESKGKTNQSAFLRAFNDKYPYHQISQPQLSTILNGKGNLTLDRLVEIAQLLNVSTDYLLGISDRLEYEEIQTISDYLGLSETSITNIHNFYTLENKQNPLDIILSSELGYSFLEQLADFLKKRNYFCEEFTTKDNDKILIDLTNYRTIKLCAITDTLDNIEMIVNNSRSIMSEFYQKKIEELNEGEKKCHQ